MIDYKVYCPSYKRSDLAMTHKLFNDDLFVYVVRESEVELYKKFKRQIIAIPDEAVSNITETRNYILSYKKSKYVVMVDDDIKAINRITERVTQALSKDEIHRMIVNGFIMAEDCDCGYWGINTMLDPRAYSINIPFYFSSVVLGPFMAIRDTIIRIDERFTSKDDYDMFLQQYFKHGRVLRFNMFNYDADHEKLSGGIQTYRNKNDELKQNELLRKKWGSKIVRANKWAEDSINPIVKV